MLAEGVFGGMTMLRVLSQRSRQIQPLSSGVLPSDKRKAERYLHQFQQVSRVNNNVFRLLNALIYR